MSPINCLFLNVGANTLPCGVPDVTVREVDDTLQYFTD